jgi:4-amino-4-deoxy-L-arabinose transferase-like glycosyltransferase
MAVLPSASVPQQGYPCTYLPASDMAERDSLANADTEVTVTSQGAHRGEHTWLVALILLAAIVRLATLGAYPLMDNTEARYAEIGRKMLETGDWITPQVQYGVPFWAKPPLSFWFTGASFAAFGVNEFAARLPQFIVAFLVAWLTYRLGVRRGGRDLALRATLVLCTTPLFFIAAGAVMTDMTLALTTTMSMVGFWNALTAEGKRGQLWGYVFFAGLGLGLVAKGPVASVLTLAPIGGWVLWTGSWRELWQRLPWVGGICLAAVLGLPWYFAAEARTPGFLEYFLVGEHWKRFTDSTWRGDLYGTPHAQLRGTIWLFALVDTLPWSLVLARLLWLRRRGKGGTLPPRSDGWLLYLWLWALASPLFFTLAGNIMFTYVITGLPAFGLLVAEAWGSRPAASGANTADTQPDRRLALAGLAVPVVMVLTLLLAIPKIGTENSQKALIEKYLALRSSDAERLVYLWPAPASAEFYSAAKFTSAWGPHEVDPYLADAPRDFYVAKRDRMDALPGSVRQQLDPVAEYGKFVLLRERHG